MKFEIKKTKKKQKKNLIITDKDNLEKKVMRSSNQKNRQLSASERLSANQQCLLCCIMTRDTLSLPSILSYTSYMNDVPWSWTVEMRWLLHWINSIFFKFPAEMFAPCVCLCLCLYIILSFPTRLLNAAKLCSIERHFYVNLFVVVHHYYYIKNSNRTLQSDWKTMNSIWIE